MTLQEEERGSPERRRVLILCVDRDDDIGVKAKIRTPLIGKNENKEAAVKLALEDPEEADANAMFAAIKLYDELKTRSENDVYQVATIAGSKLGGVQADEKIARELEQVLSAFKADSAILVSDGYTDWDLSPIIASRLPVLSVKRVIIRHSRSMELSWAILTRYVDAYLKAIAENPRYARLALGVPGVILFILSIFWALNLLGYAVVTMLALLGATMIVKGFGLDRYVRGLTIPTTLPSPIRQFFILTSVIGMLVSGAGLYTGWVQAVDEIPVDAIATRLPQFIGIFAKNALSFIVIGLCISFAGGAIYCLFRRSEKVWSSIAGIVIALGTWKVADTICSLLIYPTSSVVLIDLIFYSFVCIPLTAIGLALIYVAHLRLRLQE